MRLAPIVLFAYNRPRHLQQTVESLGANELAAQSELFIFSDGAKNKNTEEAVAQVRRYIKTIKGFKSVAVVLRDENFGLVKSIVSWVTEIINRYGRAIVMEDDLVSSPYFLKFINDALIRYENDERIISIHGYNLPIRPPVPELFFLKDPGCLGWATWKRGWALLEQDGRLLLKQLRQRSLIKAFNYNNSYGYSSMLENQIKGRANSWAILWYASAFLKDKLTLYPGTSLIYHLGKDGSGTNFGKSDVLDCQLSTRPVNMIDIPAAEDLTMRKRIEDYLKGIRPSFLSRAKRKALKILRAGGKWISKSY